MISKNKVRMVIQRDNHQLDCAALSVIGRRYLSGKDSSVLFRGEGGKKRIPKKKTATTRCRSGLLCILITVDRAFAKGWNQRHGFDQSL